MSTETQLRLAGSRRGRIALHVLTLLEDHHVAWHWKGIVREFGFHRPVPRPRPALAAG